MSDKHILIVGEGSGAKACEHLVKDSFLAKRRTVETLTDDDFEWCSFLITIDNTVRRKLAQAHPQGYLSRRVVSLNVPEASAEGPSALKRMIAEQLENHGLYVR